MNDTRHRAGEGPAKDTLEAELAGLAVRAPTGFADRVLRSARIPAEYYDRYVRVEDSVLPLPLLVAYGADGAVTATALVSGEAGDPAGPEQPAGGGPPGDEPFEGEYRLRTGRGVVSTTVYPPGLRAALRTGRPGGLRIAYTGLSPVERAVLEAVQSIPRGQLRPLAWIAREAGAAGPATTGPTPVEVGRALAGNPVPVLVPGHRVTADDGRPLGTGGEHPSSVERLLRAAEGMDLERVERMVQDGVVLLGSDTTRIYCHPTCAHARRITPRHQVPFHSTGEAAAAGYRACKSCRPLIAA
ncbi:Ada metal-binding domain-containing protein [Streptomyces yaizuensis]|uniref:MGMT family protein n=1 Tax=Streptomyces yaizuensis TaxID=2989713 RepID=A0ABQ5P590_9ACTN|nr:Ada metal-binding domain-containing protein [Streptomyces sp. YSPA8]GLF97758.1 MGMT family protein [Streptomyces sp. YSPA8]